MKLIETLVPADFRGSLTGPLRRFYCATFVSAMGSGLTYSLFVIYLHNAVSYTHLDVYKRQPSIPGP